MAEKNTAKPAGEKSGKYYDELVTVKLFKDNDKYKNDVFVAVNGVGMLVPRGKEVEIPRKYAIVLEQSQNQDSNSASLIQKMSDEFKDASASV